MRVAVYADYQYHRDGERLFAEKEFALFVDALAARMEVVLVGRLDPDPAGARYEVARQRGFVALPNYPSLGRPLRVLRQLAASVARFWRALDHVDAVWLLGPHPLSVAFALLAATRRRRVALGVRQDYPSYVRGRYPRRPVMWLAAAVLERAYRLLARRAPTVVVGPLLAEHYRHARRLLEIVVSLVPRDRMAAAAEASGRSYDGELILLSVGRLDPEKNPLILADVLALLRADDPRWRLVVCGEGSMRGALADRLTSLGLAEHSELRGHVLHHAGLADAYRESHALLHASWTEGMPQVLVEAFAAGIPVVATDVGGVAAVGHAALLVRPGDPWAAAAELRRVAAEPALRRDLIAAGADYAAAHTLDAEVERLARFLRA